MKKLFFALAVIFFAASMSSCKKNYTCTCTVSIAGVSTTQSYTYNGTNSQATSDCNAEATTINNSLGAGTASCSI